MPRNPQRPLVSARLQTFLQKDIWDIELSALNTLKRISVRTMRVLLLVLRGFRRDECVLHASSLTYMTMLSFIPVLAIAFSMARSFGDPNLLRDRLKESLHEWVAGGVPAAAEADAAASPEEVPAAVEPAAEPGAATPAAGLLAEEEKAEMMGRLDIDLTSNALTLDRLDNLIDLAFERINGINFGALGGIGVALLLWTVISVLGQVEGAFNRVWGVTEQRSLYRKFTDYLSVVVVVPLLLTAASTIPATSLLARLAAAAGGTETVAAALPIRVLRGVGMLALLTLSLAFVLRFIPNTKVRLWPGIGGGLLSAVAMTVWLRICLTFQIGLAKYSTFFGSFAVVPLLLFWVYVSWIILLVGAEFSFGLQNADTYRMEGDSQGASQRTRMLLALDLATAAAHAVKEGPGLLDVSRWTLRNKVPVRLVNDILSVLVRHGMLVETSGQRSEYAVRFDTEATTAADVLLAVLDDGDAPEAVGIRSVDASPFGVSLNGKLREALHTRLVDLRPDDLD